MIKPVTPSPPQRLGAGIGCKIAHFYSVVDSHGNQSALISKCIQKLPH